MVMWVPPPPPQKKTWVHQMRHVMGTRIKLKAMYSTLSHLVVSALVGVGFSSSSIKSKCLDPY